MSAKVLEHLVREQWPAFEGLGSLRNTLRPDQRNWLQWLQSRQLMTVAAAAKALGRSSDEIPALVRSGRLGLRWLRYGDGRLEPVISSASVAQMVEAERKAAERERQEQRAAEKQAERDRRRREAEAAEERRALCLYCLARVDVDDDGLLVEHADPDTPPRYRATAEPCRCSGLPPGQVRPHIDFRPPIPQDQTVEPAGRHVRNWMEREGWWTLRRARRRLHLPWGEVRALGERGELGAAWLAVDGRIVRAVLREDEVNEYRLLLDRTRAADELDDDQDDDIDPAQVLAPVFQPPQK